jgi:predicted neuraminidase
MQGFQIIVSCTVLLFLQQVVLAETPSAIIKSEFIYESAPFPSCHASTIVETAGGQLVTAWFGGTKEGHKDVEIWVSRLTKDQWTAPVMVANGVQADGTRWPCWNPVLFQPQTGDLMLFYKVGPSPTQWWGMLRTSSDQGITWSEPTKLPDGVLGPIKNKPLQLEDGTLIAPSSTEGYTDAPSWRIHFERSSDLGKTWEIITPAVVADTPSSIQPSLLKLSDGHLQALGRTRSGKIFSTISQDAGKSWSPLTLLDLPNPNSGTDAVTLRDGQHVLVYNHTSKGRSPLNLAVSSDGTNWNAGLVLESEPGEFSYPAIIQTADGKLHITYTWKRELIKHIVIDPTQLKVHPIQNGVWPK